MNQNELIFIFVCALLGYIVVSWFLNKKAPPSSSGSRQKNHEEAYSKEDTTFHGAHNGYYESCKEDDISKNWFNILGVSESASKDQITMAYKKKISQYHPDKVASLGVEIRALSESMAKKINAAYSYAKSLRG